MTSRAWTWRHAVKNSDLQSTTKHVLLTLSLYMNDVGSGCYPTLEDLAKDTGLSLECVCRHLAKAEQAGFIMKKKHGYGGQKWANNEYGPLFPEDSQTSEKVLTQDQNLHPEKVLIQDQSKREKVLIHDQTILPSKNSTPCSPPKSQPNTTVFSEDFERLWVMWRPVKNEKGYRVKAQAEYDRLREAGVKARTILRKAEAYIRVKHAIPSATCHLENWLSNEGVEGFKESGSAGKGNGPDGAKKADTVPSAPRPTLKPQPWQDTARIIFGDAVMRFWIEPLWLEGTAMHCPTRFIRNTVEEKYSKVLCRVTGLALTFVFAPPPPHAFVDCPPQPPTGEDHGQNEATA